MEFRFIDNAKEKFVEKFSGKQVRIFLSRKSWMGVAFDWVLDEPKEDDTVVEVEGVTNCCQKHVQKCTQVH